MALDPELESGPVKSISMLKGIIIQRRPHCTPLHHAHPADFELGETRLLNSNPLNPELFHRPLPFHLVELYLAPLTWVGMVAHVFEYHPIVQPHWVSLTSVADFAESPLFPGPFLSGSCNIISVTIIIMSIFTIYVNECQ